MLKKKIKELENKKKEQRKLTRFENTNINFKKRDLLLLYYLFTNHSNTLSMDLAYEYFYKEMTRRSFENRINDLTKAKFLNKIPNPETRNSYNKGYRFILGASRYAVNFFKHYNYDMERLKKRDGTKLAYINSNYYKHTNRLPQYYIHDRLLDKIRFILEDHGANYWMTGQNIWNKNQFDDYKITPDGTKEKNTGENNLYSRKVDAVFQNRKVYGVELELFRKTKSDYRNIIEQLAQEKQMSKVFWIIDENQLNLESVFKELTSRSKIGDKCRKFWVANLSDVLNKNFVFINAENDTFDLQLILNR